MIGGGLIRSIGGWSEVKAMRRAGVYQKGDEGLNPSRSSPKP